MEAEKLLSSAVFPVTAFGEAAVVGELDGCSRSNGSKFCFLGAGTTTTIGAGASAEAG